MSDIALIRNGKPSSLEDMLLWLSRHGSPRVTQTRSGGWYCCVEMRVSSVGVEFNVASEFGHATPTSAAAECVARVEKTLQEVGRD